MLVMPKKKSSQQSSPPKPEPRERELGYMTLANQRHAAIMEALRDRASEAGFGVTVMGPHVALRFSTNGKPTPQHNLVVVSGVVTQIYDGLAPAYPVAMEYELEDSMGSHLLDALVYKAVLKKSFFAADHRGPVLHLGFAEKSGPMVTVRLLVTSITDSDELEPEEEDK